MLTVAAVTHDGVANFELAVLEEVFGYQRPELGELYRFIVCAPTAPVQTSAGFLIAKPLPLRQLRTADIVVVPSWEPDQQPLPEVLAALRAAYERGARVMSVCTGAFLLAAAGLLDGRRATTHWRYADELARRYPDIAVDPDVLYVDEGRVLTSAGTAAGIDLCLHVVRRDYGADVANSIARRMVVPPHRDGGQAQYVDVPIPSECDDDALSRALQWMVERLDQPITVDDVARQFLFSPRTFARRFRQVTGTTPYKWLQSQRILHAQRLLESTDDPIELVAVRAGFGTPANLRQHFVAAVGTSPTSYRRTFDRSVRSA
ncbi:MAG: helix-turn-helix domain-containing protein [Actinomycetes bacterium]